MPDRPPILLTPLSIRLTGAEFRAIAGWPFADAFVGRLLRSDIPQRFELGECRMWAYRDPLGELVGFGTLDLCFDYAQETGGRRHSYIPLLAVNRANEGRGYGQFIVRHLSAEATLLAIKGRCVDLLYLDVYTTSTRAIQLYEKSGFARTSPEAIPDPLEPGQAYWVMSKRVAVASA